MMSISIIGILFIGAVIILLIGAGVLFLLLSNRDERKENERRQDYRRD